MDIPASVNIGGTEIALWMILGALAVLLLTGMLKKYGIPKKKDAGTILGVVAVALLLTSPGTLTPGGGGGGGTTDGADNIVCSSETTPDILVTCVNRFSPGSASTAATNMYRVLGEGTWTNFTCGTEITDRIYGKTYEFIIGSSTSDEISNDMGNYFQYKMKCQQDDTVNTKVDIDEDASGLSSTFYNSDDTASTAEAMGSGETATVYVKLVAGSNEVYGNAYIGAGGFGDHGAWSVEYPNMMVIYQNNSQLAKPELVWIVTGDCGGTITKADGSTQAVASSCIGQEMDQVSCPTTLTNTTADFGYYCFEAPIVTEIDTKVAIKLAAKSGVDPTNNTDFFFLGSNVFLNSDTNTLDWGVEDEDGNAVYMTVANSESLALDLS